MFRIGVHDTSVACENVVQILSSLITNLHYPQNMLKSFVCLSMNAKIVSKNNR